jgi:hypothetical protein
MNSHLNQEELVGYVTHTLTDAQREAMDRHLTTCPDCRTQLDEHESFRRRLGRELAADLKKAGRPPSNHFAAIAPHLPRRRRLARLRHFSLRLASGTAALLLFALIGWLIRQNFIPPADSVTAASPLGLPLDDLSPFAAGLVAAEQTTLDDLQAAPIYHVDLALNDDLTQLTGRQAIRYTNQSLTSLTDLYFYLLPNRYGSAVTLDEVRVEGQTIRPDSNSGSLIRLPLPRPLPAGVQLILNIQFSARIPTNPDADSAFFYQDGLLSLAYPFPLLAVYDDGWQTAELPPYIETPYTDAAWYLVRITAPLEQTIIASGITVEQQESRSEQTLTIAAGPARGFYLAAGRFTHLTLAAGPTTVNSYALPGQQEAAQAQLDEAKLALIALDKLVGPYPYSELDLLPAPITAMRGRAYPGVGLIPQPYHDLDGRDATLNRDHPVLLKGAVFYVMAHQYFGNVVGSNPVNEPWLSASLSENLLATAGGPTYGLIHAQPFWEVRAQQVSLPLDPSLIGRDRQSAEAILYGWGPIFFSSIAANTGQDPPLTFLRDYYQTYRWQIASMSDLKQQAEQSCACDLTFVFEKYLNSTGE